MSRDGCPIGYEDKGSGCQLEGRKRKIPFDVNSVLGCNEIGGKWTEADEGGPVCLMKDTYTSDLVEGWTAPIRGLYIHWWLSKTDPETMYRHEPGWSEFIDGLVDDYGVKIKSYKDMEPWAFEGYIMGCVVKDDPGYPDKAEHCESVLYNDQDWANTMAWDMTPEGKPPLKFHELTDIFRDIALNKATFFMDHGDRRFPHSYKYFDRYGNKVPMWSPDAMPVSKDCRYGQDRPVAKKEGLRPFKLRRW
jgi:hypothetical protein